MLPFSGRIGFAAGVLALVVSLAYAPVGAAQESRPAEASLSAGVRLYHWLFLPLPLVVPGGLASNASSSQTFNASETSNGQQQADATVEPNPESSSSVGSSIDPNG